MGLIIYAVSCGFIQVISYKQDKQILRKPAFS